MFDIPNGKLVFVIDDDRQFRDSCIGKLEKIFAEWGLENNDLDLLSAESLEEFEACLGMLKAKSREGDLIYALVDLMLPATARPDGQNGEPTSENGQSILRQLRDLNVPTLLMSTAGPSDVDKVFRVDQPRFWPKKEFGDERKIKEVAAQILCAKDKAPIISLDECCDFLKSPVPERGQIRHLPLAFQSQSMRRLRNQILGKAAGGAAAVLLQGEPGVEFEQLAWLLFREITRPCVEGATRFSYRYHSFNCECGGSPIDLLEESQEDGEHLPPRYLFIRNLHVLDAAELVRFCDALAQSTRIRVDGDRVVLTRHKNKGEGIPKGTERLLDLFCLAGFDDFFLLEIPALSGERPEDIAVYAEYYRRQRMEDKHESTIVFHPRGLNLIKDLPYSRHFKQLSIFLDQLFRTTGGGVISAKAVRSVLPSPFVETASREILDHILTVDDSEEPDTGGPWSPGRLHEMCSQFLREDRNSTGPAEVCDDRRYGGSAGEEEALEKFYKELMKIDEALQQASRLDTEGKALIKELQKQGSSFWPWTQYPVCPRLLKQLEQHHLTVGLVPRS